MHVSFDHKECSECAAAHWSAVTHLAGRHDTMHMPGDAQVGMAALSAVWRRFRPIHTDLVYAAQRDVQRDVHVYEGETIPIRRDRARRVPTQRRCAHQGGASGAP